MNNINNVSNENLEEIRISSREVADMMEYSRHGDLLEKIENINQVFENGKIRYQKYWIESIYKVDGNNKNYKEYLITKKGCAFLAHKSSGEKGILFTHKYMERFEQLEALVSGTTTINSNDIVKVVSEKVDNEIDKISEKYSNYIRPLAIDKSRIVKYIKHRLGITKADDDFYLVKERVLILLDADKWEDVPVDKLKGAFNLVDESIDALIRTREIRQTRLF